MRRAGALLVWICLAAVTGGCLPGRQVFPSGPYRGKVVDADTGEPLAGAAVLAVWYRETAVAAPHNPAEDYHDALEVVTDANGEFTVPRRIHYAMVGAIPEPRFAIYYPGYGSFPGYQRAPRGEALGSAFREHTVVELPKLRTRDERVRHAREPDGTALVPEAKMANLIRLVNKERAELGLEPIGGWEKSR